MDAERREEMLRNNVLGIVLPLFLLDTLNFPINVQRAEATWTGTVYIRADGSIDPPDAPVITYDNVTCRLIDDIVSSYHAIVVERDNIIIDGMNHSLKGNRWYTSDSKGVDLTGRSNVTVKNIKITEFDFGIELSFSSSNTIFNNSLIANEFGIEVAGFSTNNNISRNIFIDNGLVIHSFPNYVVDNVVNGKPLVYLESVSDVVVGDAGQVTIVNSTDVFVGNLTLFYVELLNSNNITISGNKITGYGIWSGIFVAGSSNNSISENTITYNGHGIYLVGSFNNIISKNLIAFNGWDGILIQGSYNNNIFRNNITNNSGGIELYGSSNNSISENNITESNRCAIELSVSNDNRIYHNNLINNKKQVFDYSLEYPSINVWDDGYPSGGNYWSDYTGVDLYSGPYQNETGSDGIGDTPYVIDANNADRYPLMNPWAPLPARDIGIANLSLSKNVVGQGYSILITVEIQNFGDYTENFNLILYANANIIKTVENVTIMSGASATLTITWNTTGLAKGNYTISAYAGPVPGEADLADNAFADGWVIIAMPGDVNADGIVDMRDIIPIALAFGSYTADVRYDPNYDINFDGKIDMRDIIVAALNFGKRNP